MVRKKMIVSALALSILASGLYTSAHDSQIQNTPFPKFYRWYTLVRGKFFGPNFANAANRGFDYIYANPNAAISYDSRPFNEGSVIVEERVSAIENSGDIWAEGPVTWVAVMIKDSRRCRDTGGWCFNQFFGADRVGMTPAQTKTSCFDACHARQAENDFVFSQFRKP
jgi:Cytochrome P460